MVGTVSVIPVESPVPPMVGAFGFPGAESVSLSPVTPPSVRPGSASSTHVAPTESGPIPGPRARP